jgi:hypothetical protein
MTSNLLRTYSNAANGPGLVTNDDGVGASILPERFGSVSKPIAEGVIDIGPAVSAPQDEPAAIEEDTADALD